VNVMYDIIYLLFEFLRVSISNQEKSQIKFRVDK
jgi:hypothetical protein